jgi:hypothetical protein
MHAGEWRNWRSHTIAHGETSAHSIVVATGAREEDICVLDDVGRIDIVLEEQMGAINVAG